MAKIPLNCVFDSRHPQRMNPPRRIRRIRIQIQPTRIADRVFADKPSDLGIIVPMAVVVQPCFVPLVLSHSQSRAIESVELVYVS